MSDYLISDDAREHGRTKPTSFVRERKLSFATIVGMILNSLTKSLQIKLEDFFEYVLDRDEQDILQTFLWKGKEYAIRRVVFQLESGERETLITSLPTTFQIENFSGYSVSAVLQDFYASVCINNIAATFVGDVELDSQSKKKHTYKANKNILLGKLKNRMVKALLIGGAALISLFERICEVIVRNVIPIRPGRAFPRVEGWKRLKYPPNMRGAI